MFYTVNKRTNDVLGEYSGNYFATAVLLGIKSLNDLAEHMANHNSIYTKGTIVGVLTDMVSCIKELALAGYSVKLDDLAIIKAQVVNTKGGIKSLDNFNVNNLITGIRMVAQATGEFSTSQLSKDFTLTHWKQAKDALGSDLDSSATDTSGGSGSSGDSGSSDSGDSGSGDDSGSVGM